MATVFAHPDGVRLLLKGTYEEMQAARKQGGKWSAGVKGVVLEPDNVPTDAYVTAEAAALLSRVTKHQDLLTQYHTATDVDITYGDGLDEYQRVGVAFLSTAERAILADDLGLGKSAQSIRAAAEVGAKRVLVIAKKSLLLNWIDEIDEWTEV